MSAVRRSYLFIFTLSVSLVAASPLSCFAEGIATLGTGTYSYPQTVANEDCRTQWITVTDASIASPVLALPANSQPVPSLGTFTPPIAPGEIGQSSGSITQLPLQ